MKTQASYLVYFFYSVQRTNPLRNVVGTNVRWAFLLLTCTDEVYIKTFKYSLMLLGIKVGFSSSLLL